MPEKKKKTKKDIKIRDLNTRKDPKGGPHIGMGARAPLRTSGTSVSTNPSQK